MVLNQMDNKALKQDLIDTLRLNVAYDTVPSTVIPSIQPIYNVEKKYTHISREAVSTTTGTSTTIYTTPSDKDFYLTNAILIIRKDSTSNDSTGSARLQVTIEGATRAVIRVPTFTLTAQNDIVVLNLNVPLKLDRNTNVDIFYATNAAGTYHKYGTIVGYLSDSLSA